MEEIWSNTDFPYMCLKDEIRTKAFYEAIKKKVKKGDVVVEIGAGSGILSMFAAEFGARHVYAVEIEHSLADALKRSAKHNGLDKVITVVEGDVFKVNLPKKADVLILNRTIQKAKELALVTHARFGDLSELNEIKNVYLLDYINLDKIYKVFKKSHFFISLK